MITPLVLSFM